MENGLSRLHHFIVSHYDLEELRTLCFNLGVNFDDLRGEAHSGKARELILWMGRRRLLEQLLSTLQTSRPELFSQADLSLNPAKVASLYADLPAFAVNAPPSGQQAQGHHIAQADRGGVAVVTDGPSLVVQAEGGTVRDVTQTVIHQLISVRGLLVLVVGLTVSLSLFAIILRGNGGTGSGSPSPTSLPTPDPKQLKSIEASRYLNIKALAIENESPVPKLWIASQSEKEITLYRMEILSPAQENLEQVFQTEGQLIDLAIDCHDNIWMSIKDTGALIYKSENGDNALLLNSTTTGGQLIEDNIRAIATRCLKDGSVEVWLGQKGVRTLRYTRDYPYLNDIEFVQDDTLFKKTRELTRWQDLYYVYYSADNEMLWGIDSREKQLFGFVLDSVHSPNFKELTDSRLWALTGSPGGAVWVVGEQNLTRVVMKEMDYEWTNVPLNNKAETIATTRDGREVWLGNDCSGPSSSCWPLAWYADSAESVIQVELGGERKEVHDIEIDAQGIVWIGTERGLICYPKSDCDN